YPNRAVAVVGGGKGVNAERVVADAPLRGSPGPEVHFDLGEQIACRRVTSRKFDAGRLADDAASSVAPDEILPPHHPATGQADVDAGGVLREGRYLLAAVDR